jgi:c-di-GMP-binding flagellar brake protein YcgR
MKLPSEYDATPEPVRESDRRKASRFPIARELRYKIVDRRSGHPTGKGTTIDMSSGGIYFTTEHAMLPGQVLELAVSWPAQLDKRCSLKLVARGRVVRADSETAAVEIERYEFRTVGSHGLSV